MPMELGLWRVDGQPVRLNPVGVPLEKALEDLIEHDPDILGEPLMIIGRQVTTSQGKIVDLLAVDGDGVLHAIELKRDRTPREATAQALDYGSWAQTLAHEDILDVFSQYRPGDTFEQAFAERFGVAPPEELNTSHRLTIVASDLDPATERIIAYLAGYQVPINVALFRYFNDGGRAYLARTWLLPDTAGSDTAAPRRSGAKEPWNGQDWYVTFGEESGIRSWDDARRYGFVSAGGGEWYSRSLRALPVGGRVFVYVPKTGYVAVGMVTGAVVPFDDAVLTVDGEPRKMTELDLAAGYRHAGSAPDRHEYIVPINWIKTLDREKAIREKGLFANQHSACKLRNSFTLKTLTQRFALDQ
ncbi:endonuclease NucS [Couchioplanes caeruleus]|uniref:endonuclease NucS domain-containing protein n=1 Tax=Couchioplanes caeruleus TaxID=56438 RepID=UPI00201BC954|nr:endonuclease NucS domain-containing protein [Couchioplanes caeruleus]UQU62514.1 endonuclease NucS [Couchioplanes caeruleus]